MKFHLIALSLDTTSITSQAQHKDTNHLAAAKICILEGEDDLSDFMIEIDILSECKHSNIVGLHEAFFINGKLWVSESVMLLYLRDINIGDL